MININGKAITINDNDRFCYHLVTTLVKESGFSMKGLNERLNQENNTDNSPQNLSNKLTKNSLRIRDFLQIIDILGYDFDFVFKLRDEKKIAEKTFADYASEGLTECKSINWGRTIVAGRDAEIAAQFIEENLEEFPTQDETNEIILLLAASRHFKVKCKPISNDPQKEYYMA